MTKDLKATYLWWWHALSLWTVGKEEESSHAAAIILSMGGSFIKYGGEVACVWLIFFKSGLSFQSKSPALLFMTCAVIRLPPKEGAQIPDTNGIVQPGAFRIMSDFSRHGSFLTKAQEYDIEPGTVI